MPTWYHVSLVGSVLLSQPHQHQDWCSQASALHTPHWRSLFTRLGIMTTGCCFLLPTSTWCRIGLPYMFLAFLNQLRPKRCRGFDGICYCWVCFLLLLGFVFLWVGVFFFFLYFVVKYQYAHSGRLSLVSFFSGALSTLLCLPTWCPTSVPDVFRSRMFLDHRSQVVPNIGHGGSAMAEFISC